MVKRWNIKRLIKEIERLDDEPVKEHIDLKQIYGDSVPMAQLEAEHFTEPQPIACKFCGSTDIMKYGIRNAVQNYICRKCGRKFTAKDSPYRMQTPTEQIGASLNMFYDGLSLSSIARHLASSSATEPTTPPAFGARACLTDIERSLAQQFALEAINCCQTLSPGCHLNEAKPPGLTAILVLDDVHRYYLPKSLKFLPQFLLGDLTR